MNNVVGPRIKSYIKKQGISVSYLSDKTGISLQALRRILNGKSKLCAEVYFLLCQELDLPLDYFIDSGRGIE
ncbi:helix-turn-helix domain-containing protein [Kallipyga massiliensis]|uniref:helix-turn-helix domain-containing protein n=1 Tax=Kallipyga massiliensis TaxID=1472764 RepID=UPI0004B27362